MSRFHSYINTAKQVIQRYQGDEPLSSFLKRYFASDKKFGSRDRKQISHLCYCFYRLGKSMNEMEIEEKILAGLFLCSNSPNEILQELKPGWNHKVHLSLEEKCSIFNPDTYPDQFSMLNVFPWQKELSDGIDHEQFSESFFIQPDVYLRLRPGFEELVRKKLTKAEIDFRETNSNCVAIQQGMKVENVIELDKVAVVQDLNSQRVGEFLPLRHRPSDGGPSDDRTGNPSDLVRSDGSSPRVWDCCSGSGGKSLLAYDLNPKIQLTVSDARKSIIHNLKKRFAAAGIRKYKSFIADLSLARCPLPIAYSAGELFNLIICDAPCTGSGTWSRTPEQLYFFDTEKIDDYSALQKKIIANSITQLKVDGHFVYITCSVFRKENEENVEFIRTEFDVEVVNSKLLKGYDKRADNLFVAVFKKPVS